jgi:allantoinase
MGTDGHHNSIFPYSPIVERPRLEWTNGARVAFHVGVNIGYYYLDRASTSISPLTVRLVPRPTMRDGVHPWT